MSRLLLYAAAAVLFVSPLSGMVLAQGTERVSIDAQAATTPFPHFWEQMFGSGHAILSLRSAYREDLRSVKEIADFKYVRFHGILDDEVGVYNVDEHGNPAYNFAYVDEIYDGLLPKYVAMGSPVDPTPVQVETLNAETVLGTPTETKLQGGALKVPMQPNALLLIKVMR